MKNLILFIAGGAILGAYEGGEHAAVIGAAGGFCFWLMLKIMGFLNKHHKKVGDVIEDMVDD